MRAWKIAAVLIGIVIAYFLVHAVVGIVISALISLAVIAVVAGGVYVAIKMSKSKKQVSGKTRDYEVPDSYERSLPRADVERVQRPAMPRPAASASDVEDELARMKREMGQ